MPNLLLILCLYWWLVDGLLEISAWRPPFNFGSVQ